MSTDHPTASRRLAGAACVVALVSVVASALLVGWEAAFRFGVVATVLLAVRRAQVPPVATAAFGACVLLATWASVLRWYRDVPDFDVLVHVVTPGSTAAAACFVTAAWGLLPPLGRRSAPGSEVRAWAPAAWTVALGTTIAVVWELYEWTVSQWAPATMIVGYDDTVGDLLAGMLGSAVAGLAVTRWHRRRVSGGDPSSRRRPAPRRAAAR